MKKIILLLILVVSLTSCQNEANKQAFTFPDDIVEVALDEIDLNENNSDVDPIEQDQVKEDEAVDESLSYLQEMKTLIKPDLFNYDATTIQVIVNPDNLYVMGNKINQLPSDYIPEGLIIPDVKFSFEGNDQKKQMVDLAAHALEDLFKAATDDHIDIYAVSGYRSFERQTAVYAYWVDQYGQTEADKFSARPGHSEHQTGLTMDVSCASLNYSLEYEFGDLEEGIWLAEHAHIYGFVIRYPEDKVAITGYNYEPWHLRYLGAELATYLYENNLTLEEFYQLLLE